MTLQPFDGPLAVTSHGRGWRVVHVFEDGVKHRTGTLHQPSHMCLVDLAVNVREEEQLLVSPDHETRVMDGTEPILRFARSGINRGSASVAPWHSRAP